MPKSQNVNENNFLITALNGFIKTSNDYAFIKDTNFIYRAASDVFAKMAGFTSADEIIGKTDYDLFNQELANKYRSDDKDVIEYKNNIDGITEHIPDKEGVERFTKTWKKPLFDENGKIIGLYGIGRDVTLTEAVINSDVQYFTYYPQTHSVDIYSVNNRYTGIKTHFSNYPDSFLKYCDAPEDDAQSYREMVKKIDNGAEEASCTIQITYHGVASWIQVHMKPIYDGKGNLVKVQAYSIDVTERKKAEVRINQERVRLHSLEGNTVESFSFNLSRKGTSHILTSMALDRSMPTHDEISEEDVILYISNQVIDKNEKDALCKTFSIAELQKACNAGKYVQSLDYRRRIGDRLRWVTTKVEVLPDPESGDLIAFFYTSDYTDEVISKKISLQIMEAYYETVSYYSMYSGKFYIKSAHDSATRDLDGLPYTDFVNRLAKYYVVPEEVDSYLNNLSIETITAELENKKIYSFTYTRKQKSDLFETKPNRRIKVEIFYLDENYDFLVFVLSDVTAIFEMERDNREKMAEALVAAEQASIAKTEFLSRMSHEIRTPMNAIIGLDTIALQEKNLSTSMEDHLQKIGISARFLLSLINDILDMSRIESGKMMLKEEPFNFEELISGINTILYEQCRDSEIDYDCVLKSFTEETYVGDKTKLQQVLVNILGNAVKFTPKGGKIHFMVEQVSRTAQKAKLRFEIADTGIGMDEKFIPTLFTPFNQENRGRTSVYGGTGLGLSISKNIINLMNGDITVHSIKNVGSEFTVEVQLGLTNETIHRRQLLKNINLPPLFTLVVDDDVVICQHTQQLLNEAGFETEWADSGACAITKVEEHHRIDKNYNLILLDWKMPDMDGIETAREIRRIVGPDVTIIIMTAYDWSDIEKKARAAGVDMFMKKPVFVSSITKAFEAVFLNKQQSIEPEKPVEYDFTGKRVLLAEDNEINTEIAKNLLEIKHCTVDTVTNGAEVIEAFASKTVGYYDAIFMDVRMPVLDGLEATKMIRAMKKSDSKKIPIIAMTANAFQEDVNMSLDSGMNAHLAKPIDPTTLYATLERFVHN